MPLTTPIITGTFSADSLKPQPIWYGATDDVIVPKKGTNAGQTTVIIEGGTGDVQIQIQDSSGAWITLDGDEYTITGNNSVQLSGDNSPAYKITASGDAKFQVVYDLGL